MLRLIFKECKNIIFRWFFQISRHLKNLMKLVAHQAERLTFLVYSIDPYSKSRLIRTVCSCRLAVDNAVTLLLDLIFGLTPYLSKDVQYIV